MNQRPAPDNRFARSRIVLGSTLAVLVATSGCEGCGAGPVDGGPGGSLEVVINEFMASNSETVADEQGEFDDWIELLNIGDEPVDLSLVSLSDKDDDLERFSFEAGASLEPGAYILVWADNQAEQGPLHAPFKLKKDGEGVFLSSAGEILDGLAYDAQTSNVSYGRLPDGTGDFAFLDVATPGGPNDGVRDAGPGLDGGGGETDGGGDAGPQTTSVVLNEVMLENTETRADAVNDYDPWIELYNPGDTDADISGFMLSPRIDDPAPWPFRDGTVVPAGGFLVVTADNEPFEGVTHAWFRLTPDDNTLAFFSPDGSLLETVALFSPGADLSVGRAPDGIGAFIALDAPTPDAANAGPLVADAGVDDGGVHDGGHGDALDGGDGGQE